MYNQSNRGWWLMLALLLALMPSCQRIPIGYLQTEYATFASKELSVYKTLPDGDIHADDAVPWSSMRIQGVSGTNPINYEFASVAVTDGADALAFEQQLKAGHITVSGGIINIFHSAVKKLPLGRYTISLKVSNEGYTHELKEIFTIVVREKQETDSADTNNTNPSDQP